MSRKDFTIAANIILRYANEGHVSEAETICTAFMELFRNYTAFDADKFNGYLTKNGYFDKVN